MAQATLPQGACVVTVALDPCHKEPRVAGDRHGHGQHTLPGSSAVGGDVGGPSLAPRSWLHGHTSPAVVRWQLAVSPSHRKKVAAVAATLRSVLVWKVENGPFMYLGYLEVLRDYWAEERVFSNSEFCCVCSLQVSLAATCVQDALTHVVTPIGGKVPFVFFSLSLLRVLFFRAQGGMQCIQRVCTPKMGTLETGTLEMGTPSTAAKVHPARIRMVAF